MHDGSSLHPDNLFVRNPHGIRTDRYLIIRTDSARARSLRTHIPVPYIFGAGLLVAPKTYGPVRNLWSELVRIRTKSVRPGARRMDSFPAMLHTCGGSYLCRGVSLSRLTDFSLLAATSLTPTLPSLLYYRASRVLLWLAWLAGRPPASCYTASADRSALDRSALDIAKQESTHAQRLTVLTTS